MPKNERLQIVDGMTDKECRKLLEWIARMDLNLYPMSAANLAEFLECFPRANRRQPGPQGQQKGATQ